MPTPILKPYYVKQKHNADLTSKEVVLTSKEVVLTDRAISIAPFFTAVQLASIYEFPEPNTSVSTVVGVLSFGGGLHGTIDSSGVLTGGDVQTYWAYQGITSSQMPKVIVRFVGGSTNDLSDDGSSTENTLDVSVLGSCCPNPNLTIILFVFPNPYSWVQAFQTILDGITVSSVLYKPSIISVSWGAPEIAYLSNGADISGELTDLTNLLKTACETGVNICVAAGDNGSTDNNGTTALSTDFPSSCPYVTAVGGTSLKCPNLVYDTLTQETVWNNGAISGSFLATGGGISSFFAKPSYQKGNTSNFRCVPDIALNSDPNTGYLIFQEGVPIIGIGGTSAAAPMFAGYLACINPTAFVNPLMYDASLNCFHDIKVGNNYDNRNSSNIKSYTAITGYDCVSGLGSIIGNVLSTTLITPIPIPIPTSIIITNINMLNILSNATLPLRQKLAYIASIFPVNATNTNLIWSSSNKKIATISSTGLVTALKLGKVIISVKSCDGSNVVCYSKLTITKPVFYIKRIILKPLNKSLNLSNHKTTNFKIAIFPKNATRKKIYWATNDPHVINVNSKTGFTTALTHGVAYVYAMAKDGSKVYGYSKVTVSLNNNITFRMTVG